MATPGPNLASSWTTPEQFAWLKERLPEFIERRAAAKGKISPWLSAIYDAWFAAFPLEPLTEAELQEADGDEEEARKTKVTKRKDVRIASTTVILCSCPCIAGVLVVLQPSQRGEDG